MTPLGRLVRMATAPAVGEAALVVAAEIMESRTGRLIPDAVVDVDGVGTAFARGDVLFSKLRPYLAKVHVAETSGSAIGDLLVLRPNDETDPHFVAYSLLSPQFIDLVAAATYGAKMPRASWDFVKTIPLWAPNLARQRAIADFLDRETAKIDALIEKQNALIDRLRERRTAVVVRATATQPSGAGRPGSWTLMPLKRILSDVQTGVWGDESDGSENDVPCVRVADFDRPRLRVADPPTIRSVSRQDRAKCGLFPDDLLIEKSGGTSINPVGFVVRYDSSSLAVFANFIARLRVSAHHSPRYWLYALHGSYAGGLTWRSVKQTTGIQNLDMDAFLAEPFPVPTLGEQVDIARRLDRETAKIDALIAKAERFVELVRERRSALITAAVTGQVEVNGVAAA